MSDIGEFDPRSSSPNPSRAYAVVVGVVASAALVLSCILAVLLYKASLPMFLILTVTMTFN